MRHVVIAVLAVVLGCGLAACSSSDGGNGKSSASTSPVTTATTAPTTTTASTPPSSTSSAPPLSGFEDKSSVKLLRRWADAAAKAINSGHYVDAQLRALMTPSTVALLKAVLGDEVGRHYAGPVPFTPTKVTVIDSQSVSVSTCFETDGFSTKNGKRGRREIDPAVFTVRTANGRSVISGLEAGKFSCRGVKVMEQTW